MNERLTNEEAKQLQALLVKHHNAIVTGAVCSSIHGDRMDTALLQDVHTATAGLVDYADWKASANQFLSREEVAS